MKFKDGTIIRRLNTHFYKTRRELTEGRHLVCVTTGSPVRNCDIPTRHDTHSKREINQPSLSLQILCNIKFSFRSVLRYLLKTTGMYMNNFAPLHLGRRGEFMTKFCRTFWTQKFCSNPIYDIKEAVIFVKSLFSGIKLLRSQTPVKDERIELLECVILTVRIFLFIFFISHQALTMESSAFPVLLSLCVLWSIYLSFLVAGNEVPDAVGKS